MLILPIAILVVLAFWIVSIYNFFVSSKARIKAAVQEIGNQLKRQSDLIPNIEASVKGYLSHEKGIFEELTNARKAISAASKSGDVNEMADAGKLLSDVLPKIQIIVESNPELKGAEVVTNLMDELRDTSDKVMYARRLLIDLTADFNVKRVTFPSSLIANLFKISEQEGLKTSEKGEHLEVKGKEMQTPKVDLG